VLKKGMDEMAKGTGKDLYHHKKQLVVFVLSCRPYFGITVA
jgi:hypothetical protein